MHAFQKILRYLIVLLFITAMLNAVVLIKLADITAKNVQQANGGAVLGGAIGTVGVVVMVCGDGLVHGTEPCDGNATNGSTCTGMGYADGNLRCLSNCTYNVTACIWGGGFIGNASSCNATNISNLNITIGGNGTTSQRYSDVQPVLFQNGSTPIMNFSYNFSQGNLTLANVSIAASANGIVVNLHGQLQSGVRKSLHLADANFGQLCVEDAEINALADISEACSGPGELNFDSCVGDSTGTTVSGVTCYDEGETFRFDNLQHSGVRGAGLGEGNAGETSRRGRKKDSAPASAPAATPTPGIEPAHREVVERGAISAARPASTPQPNAPAKSDLFDVAVDTVLEFREVLAGNEVFAQIGLFYLGDERIDKRVDVAVYYAILDDAEQIIAEKLETVGIQTRATVIGKLTVPLDAEPGKYWFYSRIVVGEEVAEAFDRFTVIKQAALERPQFLIPQQYTLIIIFILSIFLLTVVHHQYRLEKYLAQHEGKVSVEDLIRSGQIALREQGKR